MAKEINAQNKKMGVGEMSVQVILMFKTHLLGYSPWVHKSGE